MNEVGHACAACGCTIGAAAWGSGATCAACGWIDDFEQLVHPDLTYGANAGLSLRQAQARVRELSVTAARDPRWRPLRAGETPVADPAGPSSPVCYVATPEPAEYVPYWLR